MSNPVIVLKTAELSNHNCPLVCTLHYDRFAIEGDCPVCKLDDLICSGGSVFDLWHIDRAYELLISLPPLQLLLEYAATLRNATVNS